jgi:hypothetical protein
MKHNILLSAFGLVTLFSAFTDNTADSNDTIELVKRSGRTRSTLTAEVTAFINNKGLVRIEINNYTALVSTKKLALYKY